MSAHRDNAEAIIADIARVSGLSFARADRLSRAEAEQVIRWGETSPKFMEIYTNAAHPAHAEAQSYSLWPFYFAHDHPQDDAGEPLDWDQVRTVDDDAADDAKPGDDDDPFKGWSAEKARQRIEASLKDPKYREFRDAQGNRAHPDHELANREIARLYEIAYPERPAEPAPGVYPAGAAAPGGSGTPAAGSTAGAPGAPLDQAAALKRIEELYRDPDFIARSQSADRQVSAAATNEAAGLFQIAYPEQAPSGGSGDGAAPAAGDGAA